MSSVESSHYPSCFQFLFPLSYLKHATTYLLCLVSILQVQLHQRLNVIRGEGDRHNQHVLLPSLCQVMQHITCLRTQPGEGTNLERKGAPSEDTCTDRPQHNIIDGELGEKVKHPSLYLALPGVHVRIGESQLVHYRVHSSSHFMRISIPPLHHTQRERVRAKENGNLMANGFRVVR